MADKSQNVDGDIRKAMRHFWEAHSDKPTTSNMMLDTRPDEIGAREISEILGMLPEVKGTRVVELGSGIGRFSGHLADKAKSLLVSEFMEVFHKENIRVNGSRPNVEFLLGDATEISLPPNSVDIVFSNWLLMYLDDEEVRTLANNALSWLQEGGYFFFRESCFRLAGDFKTLKSENPTRYRSPATYSDLIRSVTSQGEDGSAFGFQIIFCKPVKTYIEKWLKPGGKLLISDYCCKDGELSEQFKKYVAQRGYNLLSPLAYGKVLEDAGFVNVNAQDKTDLFVEILHKELARFIPTKEEFLKEFPEESFNSLVNGWQDKVKRCGQGDQRWGLFFAEKPGP